MSYQGKLHSVKKISLNIPKYDCLNTNETDNNTLKKIILSGMNIYVLELKDSIKFVNNDDKNIRKVEDSFLGYNNAYLKNNKLEKFKFISFEGNKMKKFENIGKIEENLIIFKYFNKNFSIGTPVFLSKRKNFLVGTINNITKDGIIISRFNDLNKLTNYKIISLVNLSNIRFKKGRELSPVMIIYSKFVIMSC